MPLTILPILHNESPGQVLKAGKTIPVSEAAALEVPCIKSPINVIRMQVFACGKDKSNLLQLLKIFNQKFI